MPSDDFSSERVTMSAVLRTLHNYSASRINCCLPAKVESYDPDDNKANVEILINKVTESGTALAVPVLTNVPVYRIAPSQDSFIAFPITKGTKGIVIICDRSMDEYLSGSGDAVTPSETRKHDLSDAFFLWGFQPFNSDDKSVIPDNINAYIQHQNSYVTLLPTGQIKIGGLTEELISLLSEILQTLATTTVTPLTLGVPAPLDTAAAIAILKLRLDTLKAV